MSSTWIGTSGFQYPEWKSAFYPSDLPAKRMLSYYAERFNSTEINYSFRQIPSTATLSRWNDATPPRFKFSFKAPQRVSHYARLKGCADIFLELVNSVSAMKRKAGPILVQLPPNFKKDASRLVGFLGEVADSGKLAFEFRDTSWFDDEIYSILSKHNAALCIAESEDLSTPPAVTANFGYLRLRREDYTPKEIDRWAEFIRSRTAWKESFIYFKHEEKAVGPKFARRMMRALEVHPPMDQERRSQFPRS